MTIKAGTHVRAVTDIEAQPFIKQGTKGQVIFASGPGQVRVLFIGETSGFSEVVDESDLEEV